MERLQEHVDSFDNVDELWKHLYEAHGVDGAGPFLRLDALHLEAHIVPSKQGDK